MRRKAALAAAVLVLAPLAFGSLPAGAQSSAEVRSRTLFDQARQLGEANRWVEACPLFQAAHDLNSTGGTALQAANCYEKVGKKERAIELYQFILSRPDAQKNPERVAIAEERVRTLRAEIGVPAEPATAPSVTPTAPPTAAPSAPPTAEPSASAPPTAAPSAPPTAIIPPPAPPNRTPAFVAFGVGGAGLLVGAIFGGLALSQANAVNSRCQGTHCLPSDEANKNAAITKGWVSNVGFGVGIVGAAVGVVLLATGSGGKKVTATHDGVAVRF